MKKFLNFSTILFSYLLITVLVISCGGSSGGGGGTGGSSVGDATNGNGGNGGDATDNTDGNGGNGGDATNGTDGGGVPQPGAKDDCLLADRPDKDSLAAVLCQGDTLIALVPKNEGSRVPQLDWLIPSTDNAGGTGRTWDINKVREIQISYSKDYQLSFDTPPFFSYGREFPSDATITDATGHTAEFPLQILTVPSLIDVKNWTRLLSSPIYFLPSPTSSESTAWLSLRIVAQLEVKTQEDFVGIANFTITPVGEAKSTSASYVLTNDLDLVAAGGEGAKFDNYIIPMVQTSNFDFNGGGHTISLNSAIDTVANDKPAAIIGEMKGRADLENFTLNVNQPISGVESVGAIIAKSSSDVLMSNIKVNIHGSLSVYKPTYNTDNNNVYVGGVLGNACGYIENVVVKTGSGAVIQAYVAETGEPYHPYIGGLAGGISQCSSPYVSISNNLVDVTLGSFASDNTTSDSLGYNNHYISGLVGGFITLANMDNNLVRLSISRGNNLPADFAFNEVGGLSANSDAVRKVTNNLIYVDFSNLDQVKKVGGLLGEVDNPHPDNEIANNMVFIADGFDYSSLTGKFGAAIEHLGSEGSVLQFTNTLVSSPVADYDTNPRLASFVHTANKDINFNNLILDNKTNTIMFRGGGQVATLQGKVGKTNGAPLFTLAEAKTDDLTALFSAGNTSWEAVSGGYPQLKVPSDLTGSVTKADIEEAWNATNDLIQTGLADRANQ